jgi:peptidoglycan-associated lipoprotein
MVRRSRMSMQWVIVAGLIGILALGGCSKKNVSATSTGPEGRQAAAKTKGEDGKSQRGRGDTAVSGEAGSGLEPAPGELRSGGAETMDKRSGLQGTDGLRSDGSGGRADTPGSKGGSALRPDGSGEPGSPGRSTESLGPIGSGPLQGFSKGPGTESLGETPPMMITKAEPQEIEKRRARDEKRRELADIYFAFDKWALSSEGKKNLADSAEFLKHNPDAKIVIEGYCDERGSREYNLVLGEKRAKETRRYLADLGIRNPVSVTSYGKERQVCVERDEACYWRNRRAHIVLDAGK